MNKFMYKNQIIEASTKNEAIQKITALRDEKDICDEVYDIVHSSQLIRVECDNAPDAELRRAEDYGYDNLKKATKKTILDALREVRSQGAEDKDIVDSVLRRIAEKGFETDYGELTFSHVNHRTYN